MKGEHHFLHGTIKNKKGSDEQVASSTKISRITTCQIERIPGTKDLLRQASKNCCIRRRSNKDDQAALLKRFGKTSLQVRLHFYLKWPRLTLLLETYSLGPKKRLISVFSANAFHDLYLD
jgi:hypothetical protein